MFGGDGAFYFKNTGDLLLRRPNRIMFKIGSFYFVYYH